MVKFGYEYRYVKSWGGGGHHKKEAQKLLNGHWGPPHGVCGPEDVNEEATIIRKTKSETGLEVIPIESKIWKRKLLEQ